MEPGRYRVCGWTFARPPNCYFCFFPPCRKRSMPSKCYFCNCWSWWSLTGLVNLASPSCTANSVGYCKCYVDNGTSVAVQVGLVLCWDYLASVPCKASIMLNAVAVVQFVGFFFIKVVFLLMQYQPQLVVSSELILVQSQTILQCIVFFSKYYFV